MNNFLSWLKKWWWLISIIGTILGFLGKQTYSYIENNINMRNELIELKSRMEDQQKKQLTEKDVEILIQLNLSDTKQNIRDLQNILMKGK